MKITVLGAGSWGTALAILLGNKSCDVCLWGRNAQNTEYMQKSRENNKYLPGFSFPDSVVCTDNLIGATQDCSALVLALPSNAMRTMVQELKPLICPDLLLIHAGKGLESETGFRGLEIIDQELGSDIAKRTVVLSGPNLAVELVRGIPSATVAASKDSESAGRVQMLFHSNTLRVYRSTDTTGVELGGALKNVMAIGAGISDGMGYGDNTKATLVTRGLAEMVRMGAALDADPSTFMGLSGIGDLIATCSSKLSRNLRMGLMLGEGRSVQQGLDMLGQVAEGVSTCKAAYLLSKEHSINMPITEQLYSILFENKPPKQGLTDLMNRSYKEEKH